MLSEFERHGISERVYRLEFVSNHEFNDSEFSKWYTSMEREGIPLPTVYDIECKQKDIKEALEYKFDEDVVDKVTNFFT